jgi:hypothetical protein
MAFARRACASPCKPKCAVGFLSRPPHRAHTLPSAQAPLSVQRGVYTLCQGATVQRANVIHSRAPGMCTVNLALATGSCGGSADLEHFEL